MSGFVRQAAKRLLELGLHSGVRPIYLYERAIRDDAVIVACDYLAGVEDDGTGVVTEDWAKQIAPDGFIMTEHLAIEVRPWAIRVNGLTIKIDPTRGQVERLCRALGIDLSETIRGQKST